MNADGSPPAEFRSVCSGQSSRQGFHLDDVSEVLGLAWAAIDGLADQAGIARLERLVITDEKAKQDYESVIALEQGLQAFFDAHELATPTTKGRP